MPQFMYEHGITIGLPKPACSVITLQMRASTLPFLCGPGHVRGVFIYSPPVWLDWMATTPKLNPISGHVNK
ncbi:MAG TPA: hypothetical protein VFA10_31160 [Ktedonobacteraceae bacterium]|nr:hypothetical protein [Ktedonobacteraceae bacterium]